MNGVYGIRDTVGRLTSFNFSVVPRVTWGGKYPIAGSQWAFNVLFSASASVVNGSCNNLLLSFVSWVAIVKPLGRCVACDILYFTPRDTRTFQLLDHRFSCPIAGQILLGTQILQRWILFHVFHDCVLSHWGFLVPNAWNWLVDDSEVKRAAFLHFALSLLQISFKQHDWAPFLIPCGKHFGGD